MDQFNFGHLFYDQKMKQMILKKYIYTFIISFIAIGLSAQTLDDALRYSGAFPGGTARLLGTSGSFGSMGGDFGVVSINPAGIADFRSTDLTLSFSFNGGQTQSDFNGNINKAVHTNEPILENVGIVFSSQPRSSGLRTSNFLIGLHQYNNFRQDFSFEGTTPGSITQRFSELSNGRSPEFFDPFEADLAYAVGAVYDLDGDLNYETDFASGEEVFKNQTVDRSGKINELSIAWAGKFSNNLNLGIGIGIPFISFEENKIYRESDINQVNPVFEDLRFEERLATSGTGFNFKFGLGYTIEKVIRLGFAYQSPTYYDMNDNFENELEYSYTADGVQERFNELSPSGRFNYKYNAPSRMTLSIGGLIKGDDLKGFINADAQFINYSSNNFDLTANSQNTGDATYEQELNNLIDNQLGSSMNINLGGELAADKWRLRGGIGFLESPYENNNDFAKVYSFGGGFRADRIYIDVAYQIRDYSEEHVPYRVFDSTLDPVISNEVSVNKLIFTIGFKL